MDQAGAQPGHRLRTEAACRQRTGPIGLQEHIGNAHQFAQTGLARGFAQVDAGRALAAPGVDHQ